MTEYNRSNEAFTALGEDAVSIRAQNEELKRKWKRLRAEKVQLKLALEKLEEEKGKEIARGEALFRERDTLMQEKAALIAEREMLEKENCGLYAELERVTGEKEGFRMAYDTISNAFFWKMTSPLRKAVDCAKSLLGSRAEKQTGENRQESEAQDEGAQREAEREIAEEIPEETPREMCRETPEEQVVGPQGLGEHVTVLATKHTGYIARLIQHSLEKSGVSAEIVLEEPEVYGEELHIVVCPQMFGRLPKRYLCLQMEQTVSSRWLTERYFDILNHAEGVLDYSLVNIDYFKKHTAFGKKVYYLPVDYLPGEEKTSADYQYDVVFYGDTNNPRRIALLKELSEEFRVHVITELYGEDLYRELRKAKIVINLHYYERAMLETTRLYEVLSLGKSVIVSERSVDHREEERLERIVDFVDEGDSEALKERLRYWLSHEEARKERVAVGRELLEKRASAFDYYFYRFLLAQDWLTFERFYELAGAFVQFRGNRICLSLPEEVERRAAFDADNRYGFEVFPGLRHQRGWTGCGLSYKFIMKKAMEQQLDYIVVCEDDVYFPDDFERRFDYCMKYLDENIEWDVFQGLMADVGRVTVSQVDKKYDQTFVTVDHMISMVFNVYDQSIYPYLAAWNEANPDVITNTIDRALEARDMKIVATTPFLVGHKEDLYSTLWDFQNTQYNDMIARSSKKLEKLAEEFQSRGVDF